MLVASSANTWSDWSEARNRWIHYAFICGIVFVKVALAQPWLWVMWPNWLTHLSLFLIFHSIWLLLFLLVRFPPVSPLWYNMAKLTKLHHHHLVEAEFAFHLTSIPCFNPRKKAIVVYIFLIIFLWTYPMLPSIWYFCLGQPSCRSWQDCCISIFSPFTSLWKHHTL